MSQRSIPIFIRETSGVKRSNEPVTFGLPLPKGFTCDVSALRVLSDQNIPIPLQASSLAIWPDKSLKWALLDFQASVEPLKASEYRLEFRESPSLLPSHPAITTMIDGDRAVVDTVAAKFFLSRTSSGLFERVEINGENVSDSSKSKISLIDKEGKEHLAEFKQFSLETDGPLRTTFRIEGDVACGRMRPKAHLVLRITFFAGSGSVKIECTVHNPARAVHPGNYWDLGDKGSIFFKDLSISAGMALGDNPVIEWTDRHGEPFSILADKELDIYQDSSGGINWKSANHVNRFGRVPNSFCGYRVCAGGSIVREGKRATPIVSLKSGNNIMSGAISGFWQNFPKAIEANDGVLTLRLFPGQYKDTFELQGGEQKTHAVYLSFGSVGDGADRLRWVHDPLIPRVSPEWNAGTKAVNYLVPANNDKHAEHVKFLESAIKGENNFFARREIIDEYGWRNFGDLYADHEKAYYKGAEPFISHYNNQYDIVYGALVQYLQSGQSEWREIARDLARHVIDIDTYHTEKDKSAYNGGQFWHTVHYVAASTATHRSYTKNVLKYKDKVLRTGGGPANEHNYTSGLLLYYYLSGDQQAKEAVLASAEWVINIDDGLKTIFGILDKSDTGKSSSTVESTYHGPGRGAGNSINTLINAYILSTNRRYLSEAEKLIRRCIHPKDDIQKHRLLDAERRWSYTVFLQILGKYLDMKEEMGERDFMYCYARESLAHYAAWMADNEYLYLDKPEILDFPTETWAAQDMRKANVFLFGAKYGPGTSTALFLGKAKFFFENSINSLLSFKTSHFVRPMAVLLFCGNMHSYFAGHPEEKAGPVSQDHDFGSPAVFIPQRVKAVKKAVMLIKLFLIAGAIAATALVLFSKMRP